jgi:DNA-binding NarL/FixJ family response regulator
MNSKQQKTVSYLWWCTPPLETDQINNKRIILAGPRTTFRAGVARVLSLEHDMQIVAQCDEHEHIAVRTAVETLHASALIVSLPILCDHPELLSQIKAASTGLIVVAPTEDKVPSELTKHLHGTISRDISVEDLVKCVRRVSRGHRYAQVCAEYAQSGAGAPRVEADSIGIRVRNRLTRRELQVVGLIAQACKNKEIADRLGTKEQVVKNYVSNVFAKCGVADRLALALFTRNHPGLAEAAERAGTLLPARCAHHVK